MPPPNQPPKDNRSALQRTQDQQFVDLKTMLTQRKAQIQQFAGSLLDPERLLSLSLLAAQKTPALMKCSQQSIVQAVYDSARLGLEPDGVQGALIPFAGQAVFMPMFQGLLALSYEDETVQAIDARAVFEGEAFDVVFGTNARIHHVPDMDGERGNPASLRAVYAVAMIRGHAKFDVMTKAEIEAIRLRSPSVKRGQSSPWDTDYVEMAKKTVLKRISKTLPKRSRRLREALAHDDALHQREQEALDMPTVVVEPPTVDEREANRRAKIASASAAPVQPAAPGKQSLRVALASKFEHALGMVDAVDQDRFTKYALGLPDETDWTKLPDDQIVKLGEKIEAEVAAMTSVARDADATEGAT
jgi:recombination protein RecT